MKLENNNIKFVRIEELTEEEKALVKAVEGTYYCEKAFDILCATKETYDEVYKIVKGIFDKEENDSCLFNTLDSIQKYIELYYQGEDYDILGVSGEVVEHAENVMEEIVYGYNNYGLDLTNWFELIDTELKKSIMKHVKWEVQKQLEEVKKQGYDLSYLLLR